MIETWNATPISSCTRVIRMRARLCMSARRDRPSIHGRGDRSGLRLYPLPAVDTHAQRRRARDSDAHNLAPPLASSSAQTSRRWSGPLRQPAPDTSRRSARLRRPLRPLLSLPRPAQLAAPPPSAPASPAPAPSAPASNSPHVRRQRPAGLAGSNSPGHAGWRSRSRSGSFCLRRREGERTIALTAAEKAAVTRGLRRIEETAAVAAPRRPASARASLTDEEKSCGGARTSRAGENGRNRPSQ